ncbi:ankyrin repeat and SOCS box protein 15b [Takifugu rubripes]|uniref:Ankyrin repeat and SOCS box containing 15b n=1 Tax=Takifugu rubripes TaxID=31033 RepID=H2UZX1_TAKRU|nr:ankyrin repeat and SOCS box protein 15-like [Takifugu rubripes]
MDDLEQDSINQELIEFALQESIQDLNKSAKTSRTEPHSEAFTKIMAAIRRGDSCALQQQAARPSAYRERDSRGRLPLHVAAPRPQPDVLRAVLQGTASAHLTLEGQTGEGDTPLTLAVAAGLVDNVKILLGHGASPHNTNSRNESPLLIAVRQRSYDMVLTLLMGGAFVEQVCWTKWTATHEAAKVGCADVLTQLLRHGAKVNSRDGHGVTPLAIAAEHGNTEALDVLIQHGGDVNAQATNGDSVLYDAAGSGNLDTVELLLQHRADPNVASFAFQLPIHRASYEGHILVLRTLIPITSERAIHLSGQDPIHSATDGGQVECLRLLIQEGRDVNALLGTHISENYGDLRKTPLFFAISNGDLTCAKLLLAAGARTELDPLRCILVAVRAERHDLVQLLLSYGADVNCYFRVISNTLFPTALQYCLSDHIMMRLLLNSGYQAYKCFQCFHGDDRGVDSRWIDLRNRVYQIYSQPDVITFCEFVSVSWLTHLVGGTVRTLLDYVSYVSICPKLRRILKMGPEWEEISDILSKPRTLQHLCRLAIRGNMSLTTLNDPRAMAAVPLPPTLQNYVTFRSFSQHTDLTT